MTEKETKVSLKEDLAACEKESLKWEKKYDKANIAAHSNLTKKSKEAPAKVSNQVGEIELNIAQIRPDGSATYMPKPDEVQLFGIGEVTVKPGFLPKDIDFNRSFIEAETNDPKIKAKQNEFSKYLKLKVKIEM